MAVVDKGSLPSLALKVFEETAATAGGDFTIAHGLPFTPKVYSLVAKDAAGGALAYLVKSVDATNVIVTVAVGTDSFLIVVGP